MPSFCGWVGGGGCWGSGGVVDGSGGEYCGILEKYVQQNVIVACLEVTVLQPLTIQLERKSGNLSSGLECT
jgi:hypothetical protein